MYRRTIPTVFCQHAPAGVDPRTVEAPLLLSLLLPSVMLARERRRFGWRAPSPLSIGPTHSEKEKPTP